MRSKIQEKLLMPGGNDIFPVIFVNIFHVANPLYVLGQGPDDFRQIILIQPILDKTFLHPITYYVPQEFLSRNFAHMLSKSEAFEALSQLHNSGFLKNEIFPSIIGNGFFYYNNVRVTVSKLTRKATPKIVCHQNTPYTIE